MAEIPEWNLGWRMRRALAHAGVSVEEIAAELGVSRSTVSGWLNSRGAEPRIGYVKLWAMSTGVPLDWLLEGATEDPKRRLAQGVRTAPIRALEAA